MTRRFGFSAMLAVVAVIALAMRVIGINWDLGLHLHPDERFVIWVTTDLRWPSSIGDYFNSATSPLNPYNTEHKSYVYGTFPAFLVKAIAGLFGRDNFGEMYLVGRATSAIADTGTVVLTALIARRFFGEFAAIIAGILLAFTPLFLQSAHFFTVDSIAVFFTVAAFVCVLKSWDRQSIGWMALAGAMIGLAGASKPNYLIALAFIALPVLELIRLQGWQSLLPKVRERVYPAIPAFLTGGFVAFWVFRIAQPYAFAGPHWYNISLNPQWRDDIAFWRAVQTGLVDMKPSIQWVDRTPVVYILQNMVMWGMGVLLGVLSLVALGFACWRIVRSERWPSWWMIGIVGWCLGSIALYGTGIAQNQRYLIHIYPFLIVLGAGLLVEIQAKLSRKWFGQAVTILVVVYTVVFGAAFDTLYVRPITRIEASEWIYDNLPDGSVISNEYWDDALPQPLPDEDRGRFTGLTLDLYADESADSSKASNLVAQLSQVDYVVLSSNRVIDSVVRQPERYPIAIRYYEMLLNGELGFELVADFTQTPSIAGITWDDRSAEESLTVYEHPQVRIFRKTESFNPQYVFDELTTAWGTGGYHYIPGDPMADQMLMSPAQISALDQQGGWGDQVGAGLIQQHPLISFWLVLQIIGVAAWPAIWRSLRKLPDTGWLLAKPVGSIALAAITLVLVSWANFSFGAGAVLGALAILAAIGIAVLRGVRADMVQDARAKWRQMITGELIFLVAFVIIALVRSRTSTSADAYLMQLTGTMRSITLPPQDPWLSGGILHTHWAGLLPWAAIGRLLSLEPIVVYQLAIISMGAMIAGVIWSLTFSVTRSWAAVGIAAASIFGTSLVFTGGLAPVWFDQSVNIVVLTLVMTAVVLVHLLIVPGRSDIAQWGLLALASGLLMASAEWGMLVTLALVATGLALSQWLALTTHVSWWPVVRRFTLMLVGIAGTGLVIWYPAISAFTATSRNFLPTSQTSIAALRDDLGFVLILMVLAITVTGAIFVTSTLWTEGAPGIIVSGIAVAAMIAFVLIAWRLDSAIVLLFLFSLLAVIGAWHWMRDRVLLWSLALVALASMFLIYGEAQRFHADLQGTSTGNQLTPLAWTLMLVAVGLALSTLTRRVTSHLAAPAMTSVAILMLALVVPTADHVRTHDWIASEGIASPSIAMSSPDLEAAHWLQANANGMPVILTSSFSGSGDVSSISALTGFPTVLGTIDTEQRMRPGWSQMVDSRMVDIDRIYTNLGNWDIAGPLLEKYDVTYIIVREDDLLRSGGEIDRQTAASVADGHLELMFEAEGITIYRVNRPIVSP